MQELQLGVDYIYLIFIVHTQRKRYKIIRKMSFSTINFFCIKVDLPILHIEFKRE